MKMIPSILGRSGVTTSERRVFDSLKSSDISGTTLHSLYLPTHGYKLTAELDFVLVLNDIVLAVEVKGAQVSCAEGVWTYTDSKGHWRQDREGPFKQVSTGMYALRTRLENQLGSSVRNIPFGYLVVTTDVDIALNTFEWDVETYCGRGSFNKDFAGAIKRAVDYWLKKQPGKPPISKADQAKIVQKMRPDFERSPLLDAQASALDLAQVRLTDEQFTHLDLVSGAPRVICNGGAGTGKTFLATEIARREAESDKSVLFVCRSEVLAEYVKGMLKGSNVEVRAASDLPTDRSYDVAIIDEAQDLMTFECLGVLEGLIEGGWQDGRWIMFMDQNRQAHLYGDFEPEALKYIESFRPVPAGLRSNCRNTREITYQTRVLTGADTGVAAAGSGPETIFKSVIDGHAETVALLEHLRSLRENEVPREHITIVSLRGDWESSAARDLRETRKGQVQILDKITVGSLSSEKITWSSAVDIKGLENRFICVIDIDGLETKEELDQLYVALSRPRVGLWVAHKSSLASRMLELYKSNAQHAQEVFEQKK